MSFSKSETKMKKCFNFKAFDNNDQCKTDLAVCLGKQRQNKCILPNVPDLSPKYLEPLINHAYNPLNQTTAVDTSSHKQIKCKLFFLHDKILGLSKSVKVTLWTNSINSFLRKFFVSYKLV